MNHSSAPYTRIRNLHTNIEESGIPGAILDLVHGLCEICVHELPGTAADIPPFLQKDLKFPVDKDVITTYSNPLET